MNLPQKVKTSLAQEKVLTLQAILMYKVPWIFINPWDKRNNCHWLALWNQDPLKIQLNVNDIFVLSPSLTSSVPGIDLKFQWFRFAALFLLMAAFDNQIIRQWSQNCNCPESMYKFQFCDACFFSWRSLYIYVWRHIRRKNIPHKGHLVDRQKKT